MHPATKAAIKPTINESAGIVSDSASPFINLIPSSKASGQLALQTKEFLMELLGKSGDDLYNYARGLDCSPVKSYTNRQIPKSIGNGTTFPSDLIALSDIKSAVTSLSDTVSMRLRKADQKCTTVQIVIKFPDFKSISRQMPLNQPTFLSHDIATTAMTLFESSIKPNTPIRMITITALNLISSENQATQLSLFATEDKLNDPKQDKLETALFAIKDKYGLSSVKHGSQIKKDF